MVNYITKKVSLDSTKENILVSYIKQESCNHDGHGIKSSKEKITTIHIQDIHFSNEEDLDEVAFRIVNSCKYLSKNFVHDIVVLLKQLQSEMDGLTGQKFLDLIYSDTIAERLDGMLQLVDEIKGGKRLTFLVEDDQLVSALSRILRENYKESSKLSICLCKVLHLISSFEEGCEELRNPRLSIMAVILRVIDYELKKQLLKCQSAMNESSSHFVVHSTYDDLFTDCFKILSNVLETSSIDVEEFEESRIKENIIDVWTIGKDSSKKAALRLVLILSTSNDMSYYLSTLLNDHLSKVLRESPCDEIVEVVLQILLNLSLDIKCQNKLFELNYLPIITDYIHNGSYRDLVIGIFYNCSQQLHNRKQLSRFEQSKEIITVLHHMSDTDLALLLNLTACTHFVVQNCRNEQFIEVVVSLDPMKHYSRKILRNCLVATAYGSYRCQAIMDKASSVAFESFSSTSPTSSLLESIRILQHLEPKLIGNTWATYIQRYDLIVKSSEIFSSGIDDDLRLELIIFFGRLCDSEESSLLLIQSYIPSYICNNLDSTDTEIIYQSLKAMSAFLIYPGSCNFFISELDIIEYLECILRSPDAKAIHYELNICIELIIESDFTKTGSFSCRSKDLIDRYFQYYNKEWLVSA